MGPEEAKYKATKEVKGSKFDVMVRRLKAIKVFP